MRATQGAAEGRRMNNATRIISQMTLSEARKRLDEASQAYTGILDRHARAARVAVNRAVTRVTVRRAALARRVAVDELAAARRAFDAAPHVVLADTGYVI